jgi:leucyl aminopeptidase
MIHEWNAIEVKLGLRSEVTERLAVVDFGSRMGLMDILEGRAAAKEALSAELKKIKKDEEQTGPKTIRIPFEGKGGLTALLHSSESKAFQSQTALRKAFLESLKTDEASKEVQLSLRGLKDSHAEEYLNWVVSLAVIARYRPPVFGKKAKDQKSLGKLTLHVDTSLPKKVAEGIIQEGLLLGFANNQVRHLAELPSNVLHPGTYRERAEKLAKELKVKCEFLGIKDLKKIGAGAFLAVVQADQHERGGIVHLHYSPGKKSKKKVSIVGKGLCFDTGGNNIKTGDFMFGMNHDMTGSAIALALFQVLVMMDAPYEVHAYLALAENLVNFDAYRPNDVVVASNGMSIEVDNTDAEGRMCLSDTLAIASNEKPDLILDFATLTGSVIRSIDTRRSGVYSNDLKLSSLAVEAGERVGERVWNFPIGEDYQDSLKSDYADLRQLSRSKAADHIYAATFLSHFVGKGIQWLHVDLAAGSNAGGLGLVPTETTGFGVRFGLAVIRDLLR